MVKKWYNLEYEIVLTLIAKDSHVRMLAVELKEPHSSVLRKLGEMKQKQIVDYRTEGKNKVYYLKKNIFVQKSVINAENYKLLKIADKHPFLSVLFKEVISNSDSPLIILFGSYAKGISKEDSDIDIFVESKSIAEKRKIQDLHHKLSLKIGILEKDSLLGKEIIKNHAILKGAELYYEKIGFFK